MSALRGLSQVLAVLTVGVGVALIVATQRAGGGIGYLFGALFVAAGAGRLYLMRRR